MAATVSDWWANHRKGYQHTRFRVELLDQGGAPFKTTADIVDPLIVTGGSVSIDRARSVWGQANLSVLIPWDASDATRALLPTSAFAPLSPTSSVTARVAGGFLNPYTGQDELVYVGRFDLAAVDVSESAEGIAVELQGEDLTGRIDVADIPIPIDISWDSRVIDAAKFLVSTTIPWMTYQEDASWATTARVVLDEQANRLAEVQKMMTSIGFEAFMDPSGTFMRMRRIPTTADVATWVFDPEIQSQIVKVGQGQDRRRIYNGVIVKGENPNSTDPPVRAETWITDTSDPTHYIPTIPVQTIIGPRPYFFTSQFIRTVEQAQDAANSELRRIRGLLQRVYLSMPVDPAVQAGDVVFINRPDIGVAGRYVVGSIGFPLDGGAMTISCEERRV